MHDGTKINCEIDGDPSVALPRLRTEIEISAGAASESGAPQWVIHDPLQHRYFQIDEGTRNLLSLWRPGLTTEQLALEASETFGEPFDVAQIDNLLAFVRSSNLCIDDQPGGWRDIQRRAEMGRQSRIEKLFHNYLCFKLPLVHPHQALRSALPFVEPFYAPWFGALIAAIGLTGLYLTSRQWDTFVQQFDLFFSWQGIVYFLLSLSAVKVLHELGHAITATRLGCRVPTMGVAFIFLTPMLYSDVSDSWRLSSRHQRISIGAAGIIVELGLACVATFFWAFLPEGSARSVAFMIATTGWLLSLGINLNPCMKFDGYFLLSDFIGVDNLQSRAFALGRWKMRKTLLAPTLEPPEQFSAPLRNGLIFYAWITWIFRLILFTTIALAVYHYCFKVLGIILFAAEIWYLIARPISQELWHWYNMAPQTASLNRFALTAAVSVAALAALVVPWSGHIVAPGLLQAADLAQIYPTRAAHVLSVEITREAFVSEGRPIVRLESPEIDSQIWQTQIKHDLIKLRLVRAMVNQKDRENLQVLRHKLASLETELIGLNEEKNELVIRAPVSGTLLELNPLLHPGRWIRKTDRLALIAARNKHVVNGYLEESDIDRLTVGSQGKFIPDDLTRPSMDVTLVRTAPASSPAIKIVELASTNGGQIAVEPDEQQLLVSLTAKYLVELTPQIGSIPPNQTVRGVIELNGTPKSFASRIWNQISKIFVRESGF